MTKKKSKKKALKVDIKHLLVLFLLLTGVATFLFLTKNEPANAAASFYTTIVTPSNEVKRGGPLVFDVKVQGQSAGSSAETGIQFDKRKLRLDSVESGELGSVTWESIADEDNKSRIVIHNTNVNSSEDNKQFARLHFTIIDQTEETNEHGMGFVELCTTFDPGTVQPTAGSHNPTQNLQPTNALSTIAPNTPVPTRATEPIPTAIPQKDLDISKLCIPLEIHGSPADKMDIVMLPINYEAGDFNTFASDAQKAIGQLNNTNLSSFRPEVLDKMNWYLLNTSNVQIPQEYRNRKIGESEFENFLLETLRLCPHDRYVVFINADGLNQNGAEILGSAILYEGFVFAARSVDVPNSNVFAHEWGHASSGLLDEYDAGKWFSGGYPTTGYNCTRDPSNSNPVPDPCPRGSCDATVNDSKYKKSCPQWDCSQIECDPLQKELFANAGCYQRCSSQNAYRSAPLSIMDAYIPSAGPDITKYNGPSLYSIIKYTFGNYR